jgi:hypothetical protein
MMVYPKLKQQQVRRPIASSSGNGMCLLAIVSFVAMILFLPWKFARDVMTNPYDDNYPNPSVSMPPWKEGYLDIHHIHAGVNVATFLIFPDGTTMLIDCGDLDIAKFNQKYGKPTASFPKLEVVSPYPNQSKTTGQWVTEYIHHFWPYPDVTAPNLSSNTADDSEDPKKVIDIMMITHFHQDHIGSIYTPDQEQKKGKRGDYIRTGIVEVGDEIDFTTIIDRGYPKYDFPFDLEQDWESAPFLNYLNFVRTSLQRETTKSVEQFQVGSYTQIGLRKTAPGGTSTDTAATPYGHFRIRNIKANLEYSYATPENHEVKTIPGKLLNPAPGRKSGYTYDENKVSTAIVVEYGKFRYYEGGDQEYHNNGYPLELPGNGSQYELDTVTPTAQMAGPVHVASLNHHGHGVLQVFCDILNPKVLILQGWCTDQPPNHSMETLRQQKHPADLFATWVSEERLSELRKQQKRWSDMFKSTVGHIVVRVEPPPLSSSNNLDTSTSSDEQKYHVYILNGNRHVSKYFGPYHV